MTPELILEVTSIHISGALESDEAHHMAGLRKTAFDTLSLTLELEEARLNSRTRS